MADSLAPFHPLIAGWFRDRFGAPTEPQRTGWPRIHAGKDVLIAAPTGSGKTLAAFLACLDDLVRRGLERPLQGTQILYISPLKALSNDVHRNLEAPLAELKAYAAARGERFPEITVATRTGDTPMAERARLAKHPPHILVTTPESLFILLTSQSGRAALSGLRTVIVDEIHAIAGDKRGAHLAISLERLDRLVSASAGQAGARSRKPVRVGLSATQRPIEKIARMLVGTRRPLPFIADAGHRREIDLAIEITDDELAAIASNEQFGRVYDRIAELVMQHQSTIVFVNTRRLVERAAAALEQRLGEENVVAHHGSMSRTLRLAAEQKLKYGRVRCAVATASLELGIDVGAVDLVVQLGSPRSIATLLQRVGRSGHTLGGTPKGRLFALTRDQLVECAALVRGVRRGNLDAIGLRDAPLDILAQQIVAMAAAEELPEAELAELIRGATPYAELPDDKLEQVLQMISEGVSDRRGRSGAHVHRDRVAGKLKGRRGARLAAITSGGAIPDMATYQVVQWPEEIQVGTLDEDFAIESSAGDIFQLGNTAWKIRRIEAGRVMVEDAHGQPPTIPFWVGEGPARTRELSDEVSDFRREIDHKLDSDDIETVAQWVVAETSMSMRAAQQLVAYLVAGRVALGVLPRNDVLVAERFFDEAGGMQLVIHAPLGGRINRAWGLALRKKFCRTFDFELQAAATDDGIVISLGQPHSFALETVFGFVSSHSAQDTLIQALLDRPMFEIRWRWNVTRSLVVLRRKAGKKIPPHLIKMRAADTLSVVFPQAQACPENLPGSLPGMPGDREIPDHPLVFETIRDCLVEAMDVEGYQQLIEKLEAGEIRIVARDTVEPSPLSHEMINANPYAYLDDAPLEERRTRAVVMRRGLPGVSGAANDDQIGALDEAAIAAASEEVAPVVRDLDELHDALLGLWLVPEPMGMAMEAHAVDWFEALAAGGRAVRLTWESEGVEHAAWCATDKLGAVRKILGEDVACNPPIATPAWAAYDKEREVAIQKLVGAHLDHRGPVSTRALAAELGLPIADVVDAVLALEGDGGILRGRFTSGQPIATSAIDESRTRARSTSPPFTLSELASSSTVREAMGAAFDTATLHDVEWCNRRVLARIHRMTLAKLRKEIEPVSAAALQRFLLRWQRVAKNRQLIGADGLAQIVEQLQGFETASGAWEREILPSRICNYDPAWLDQMCLAGHLVWCRLSPRKAAVETEPDEDAANDELADDRKLRRGSRGKKSSDKRLDKKLIAPLRDLFGDSYDLAEAGAEAARLAGGSREEITAAATKALGPHVPVRAAEVIASLVTATAMLKNEADEVCELDDAPPARGSLPEIDDAEVGIDMVDGVGRVHHADRPISAATGDQARSASDAGVGMADGVGRVQHADRRGEHRGATSDQHAARPASTGRDETGTFPPISTAGRDQREAGPVSNIASAGRDEHPERFPGRDGDPRQGSVSSKWAAATSRAEKKGRVARPSSSTNREVPAASALVRRDEGAAVTARRATTQRSAPSRSAPLALMLRRDVAWLRAAAAVCEQGEAPVLGEGAQRVRDHLAKAGASFLPDLCSAIELPPDEIEDALWELVGAGLATADGFASLRVLVDRKRGEVKSLFDKRTTTVPAPAMPVRKWQDAIKKVRTHDRSRPGHALRSLPTAAGRWSLLPPTTTDQIDAEATARQLLLRYGVVFRDLITRESSLPPWRDILVALRRLEARGEIRGGRFVSGFVGEQFALPEALDELRAVRHPSVAPDVCKVAATDPLNLVGVLSPGPRVPSIVGNAVLYVDGQAVASLEAGQLVRRAPIPQGARIDDDLTYHPPPPAVHSATQAALPW